MKGQKSGRCWAIVPGLRRIPAPIEFPTATAIPNVRPSTVRSLCVPDWAEDTSRLYGPSPGIGEWSGWGLEVIGTLGLGPWVDDRPQASVALRRFDIRHSTFD